MSGGGTTAASARGEAPRSRPSPPPRAPSPTDRAPAALDGVGDARSVLLGFGGTVDVEIEWDARTLAALADEHAITHDELDVGVPVVDARSLVVSILAFVEAGVGGERFVADPDALESLLSRVGHRATLGGTGVRAALALDTLGVPSIVQLVSVDDTVRRLLPERVEAVCSAREDAVHPHLIVQYPAGATIATSRLSVTAPRANRLIYVNDPPNRDLVLGDRLERMAPGLGVLLVSGLNTMRDLELVEDRIATIERIVAAMPDDGVVMLEDAGYHLSHVGERVRGALARLAHVTSMNEDELQSLLDRSVDLLDADVVERALDDARERLGARTLVVHTQHWAIADGVSAAAYVSALRSGVVTAATRFVVDDAPTKGDYARIARSAEQREGAAVVEALSARAARFAGVAALDVHPERATTIGLGDAFVGGFIAALAGAGAGGGNDA